jgi:Calcineurin-like phosphoesterase
MMRARSSRPLVLLGTLLLAPAVLHAADDPCNIGEVARVVAVGDVHGGYDNFVSVLRMAGLVDEKARWSGGQAYLVQVGDVFDRGPDTRRVLDLMMRLEKEAKKAGGRVHALLGNHEVMNILGDLRYVNPEEYESFRTPRSVELRERFYQQVLRGARERAKATGKELDEKEFRKKFEEEAPLGFVERTRALSAEGEYGRWLRSHSVVARVDDVVFVHGGLTPEVAALGCRAINETVRREITTDIDKTRRDPQGTLAAGEGGPLWYRGLAQEDEATLAPKVEQILRAMDARALVVGHTVTKTGRIQERLGGRIVMIDVGMSPVYQGGHLAALEVRPGARMTALYPGAREPIAAIPAAAAR